MGSLEALPLSRTCSWPFTANGPLCLIVLCMRLDQGRLSEPPIKVDTASNGFVRELDFGVMIDLETAKAFSQWLSGMIAQADAKWPMKLMTIRPTRR